MDDTLSVTLEQVAEGAEEEISLMRQCGCARCSGTGAEPEGGLVVCSTCEGTGKSPTRKIFRADCPQCDGTGKRIQIPCRKCSGAGLRERKETLRVRIPPGVATGQKLKLRGKGNQPTGKGAAGDLYVLIAVDDHPVFRRRGPDIFTEIPLTFVEATLGTELSIPTLSGSTRIRIPSGTPSGKVFRLAGRGLASGSSSTKGDLHVRVEVEVPTALTDEQRTALRRLSDVLPPLGHPRRRAFEELLNGRS